MAAKVLSLGLLLAGPALASAQSDSQGAAAAPMTLHFRKPAGQTWVPAENQTVAPARPAVAPPTFTPTSGVQQAGYKPAAGTAPTGSPMPMTPTQPARQLSPLPAPTATQVYSNTPVMQPKSQLPALQVPTTPVASTPPPAAKPAASEFTLPPARQEITRTGMQQSPSDGNVPQQDQLDYSIFVSLIPPGPQRLFRLESERDFKERLRMEARERPIPEQVEFPPETQLTTQKSYSGRSWPRMREPVEPNYVCHGRLLFEEMNTERFAWDLGIAQPLVSSVYFGWDLVTVPYHLGTAVCRRYECSAGKCLPGNPVPYMLYPPELSVTGSITEAAVIIGLAAVFP